MAGEEGMCGWRDDVHSWGIWMAAKGVVDYFAIQKVTKLIC